MWVIELGVVQLVGDLLSQLESRIIAGDEQGTQPEATSQAQSPSHHRLTILQNSVGGGGVTGSTCPQLRDPHLPQQTVLMVPQGDVLILGRIGDYLNETPHLGLSIQGHAEELWQKHRGLEGAVTAWATLLPSSLPGRLHPTWQHDQPLTNGGIVDVIVGSNHAQVQGCHVHLVLYADALGLLQVTQGLLHQL